jgi:hypothetical protein
LKSFVLQLRSAPFFFQHEYQRRRSQRPKNNRVLRRKFNWPRSCIPVEDRHDFAHEEYSGIAMILPLEEVDLMESPASQTFITV